LFRDAVNSGCGFAESATGPFYCPQDQKVYLDLGFFNELDRRFGAPGDFAQAYVIAHEFGHHVQNLLGLTERAAADRRSGANSASVAT
jgi:predicted metalloprotease